MDNKTNRIFSIGLITIMMLSILMIAVPVAAKTCRVSIGVQCEQKYYTNDETFVNRGSISNNGLKAVTYSMGLTLLGSIWKANLYREFQWAP